VTRTLGLVAIVGAVAAVALTALPASAFTPTCSTGRMVVWLDTNGDHAAGSAFYHLEFTNLSSRPCTLRGYPGVSAVTLTGRQVGTPASRNPAQPVRTVTLAGGASAAAVLQIANAQNFPQADCRPTTAAGLRIYPPNSTASRLVPFPFLACARAGPSFLHVQAVQTR
jgi:Domain of unknown function (DUF4232)